MRDPINKYFLVSTPTGIDDHFRDAYIKDTDQIPQTDEQWAQDIIDQIEAAKGIPSSEQYKAGEV